MIPVVPTGDATKEVIPKYQVIIILLPKSHTTTKAKPPCLTEYMTAAAIAIGVVRADIREILED